ncbi:endonuclease/exonuclease/phosphatase family protein [Streptomyces sp. NPDC001339]|uniref:endonuclease/exonuclease/phosphatase family protein n=1 Tax=Streptomyces sp. NPDC001339 TaxID=3364563 RepID=UPI0036939CC0
MTVMSQNVQYGADKDGRWDGIVEQIRSVAPQLVLLQEVDFLSDPDAAKAAENALALRLTVAPSRNLNTAVAWDPEHLQLVDVETKYSLELHHGYCAPQFIPLGLDRPLPAPLVAISTHLTPYSAQVAAQEAQLLCARAYRYGGIALVGGDINHMPLGDQEIDWSLVQPYNRTSRCHQRKSPNEPWRGNRIVGETLRDGEFTDVAAHLADLREDPTLRAHTGKHGLLRVDQTHVTPALIPTITDYQRVDPGPNSDHYGLLASLDLNRVDHSQIRAYA